MTSNDGIAWHDCVQVYEDSDYRLQQLTGEHEASDARTWLSAAMTSHTTCMDGMRERNVSMSEVGRANVTLLLSRALAMFTLQPHEHWNIDTYQWQWRWNSTVLNTGLLASWNASIDRADMVVAKDGSGNYKTINEAVTALSLWRQSRNNRLVVYVKLGVYAECVEIDRNMKNVMFVGDGIDKTVVTGNRNVPDGSTTFQSATFGVSGDGFWARDMTFENTAGPEKHQAVALRVGSDLSVFYRCSFNAYQDTLFVHSQRQFYRDCHVYGTIDFIFGNAAVVLQNCDINVRRPMLHQSKMITAQGRDDPYQNTGISIYGCRVMPAQDFEEVKESFKSYLGRPWKKYSRTVFMKTDLDGLIHPEGWSKWRGDFALDTLYYGEYMNIGKGALTSNRVNWPRFHVLNNSNDADLFTVQSFIHGQSWIPETGVPFLPRL